MCGLNVYRKSAVLDILPAIDSTLDVMIFSVLTGLALRKTLENTGTICYIERNEGEP